MLLGYTRGCTFLKVGSYDHVHMRVLTQAFRKVAREDNWESRYAKRSFSFSSVQGKNKGKSLAGDVDEKKHLRTYCSWKATTPGHGVRSNVALCNGVKQVSPILSEGDVHVWCAFVHDICHPDVIDASLRLLTPEERRQADAASTEDLRRQRIASKAHARSTLAYYCGEDVDPATLRFHRATYGKPELAWQHLPMDRMPPWARQQCMGGRLRFNMSNTASLVTCAVTLDAEIGVDAEELQRLTANDRDKLLRVARRWCSPEEVRALLAMPVHRVNGGTCMHERFLEMWTLKESFVKADGRGIAGVGLANFSVQFEDAVEATCSRQLFQEMVPEGSVSDQPQTIEVFVTHKFVQVSDKGASPPDEVDVSPPPGMARSLEAISRDLERSDRTLATPYPWRHLLMRYIAEDDPDSPPRSYAIGVCRGVTSAVDGEGVPFASNHKREMVPFRVTLCKTAPTNQAPTVITGRHVMAVGCSSPSLWTGCRLDSRRALLEMEE